MRARALAALPLLAAAACNRSPPTDPWMNADMLAAEFNARVTGRVVSTGGALGDFTLEPIDCQSGEHYGYFGVDLYQKGSRKAQLRLVKDEARGLLVKIHYPKTDDLMEVFTREDCSILDGRVDWTNRGHTSYGGPHAGKQFTYVEGRLRFDCRYEKKDGGAAGHVTGDLTFTNCG